MGQLATEPREIAANTSVEVRGDTLVVNINKRHKASMYVPTLKIPLGHVLDAQADPQIERKHWREWVLNYKPGGMYGGPASAIRFYAPQRSLAYKAIVIRLRDEGYERLVVEVDDPDSVVEQINEAVGARSRDSRELSFA